MDKQFLLQLELLRHEMVETAMQEQNLLHHDVIQLSQSLDEMINIVQSHQRELVKVIH
ncbi:MULTISPECIES: aspartyl-phosphate phosphatase Spo0E family protein [unclassified Paenibacillus]|uniref:aspartyl-phosphate phosphatase Spo0E family protein n=1 Tax=unclassified Paenibacillus TaxID=185978 RepID=UPI002F42C2D5